MIEHAQQTISLHMEKGLHLRPAQRLASYAETFQAQIFLTFHGNKASVQSVLEILGLEVLGPCELTISAEGPDAVSAVNAVCSFLRGLAA